jgi:hypothetical protein
MIALIISYLAFNIYACISGLKDSILYSLKGAESFPWNEHTIYTSERIAIVVLIVSGAFMDQKDLWVLILCIAFSFSFWHNGFYYEGRSFIDKKEYSFISDSTSSTAKLEVKWITRLIMKIVSILFLTGYIIFR